MLKLLVLWARGMVSRAWELVVSRMAILILGASGSNRSILSSTTAKTMPA